MPSDAFLTTGAVARELRCSEALVRKLANAGRLQVERADSGLRLFRRADVERLKRERARTRPSAEA